jgi:hypothetical protein
MISMTRPASSQALPEPYPNIFIDERAGMRSLGYLATLREVDEAVNPQLIASTDAPALIGKSGEALRAALAEQPRDLALVRRRAIQLAANTIRAIKAVDEAGELGQSYVTPSSGRPAALIEDRAPGVGELTMTGDDDPVGHWGREIAGAVERYIAAKPRTFGGSTRERVRSLYRIVALSANGAAALPTPDHSSQAV